MAQESVIELSGVSVYYDKYNGGGLFSSGRRTPDELILSEVELSIAAGEMVYFIGKVGSGKSTLLKTLYAEVPLYQGSARVVGYNLRGIKRSQVPYLRRKIGIVFQDYQLLTDRNIYQNLRYVMHATGWKDEQAIEQRIDELLAMVGLTNKEYKMPFELSGGQQQRLSIARALINRPSVILADEPTGNLDPAAADEIMELFHDIAANGCAVVMSTHNINNIQQYPSRTVRFSMGRVEEIDIHSILGL